MAALIDIPMPANLGAFLNSDIWDKWSAHPYALLGLCDHVACAKPADFFMLNRASWGSVWVGARCKDCMKFVDMDDPDCPSKIISEKEAREFVLASHIHMV